MSEIELHRKLLGDTVRNDALGAALARVLKPGMSVADIGAGTGFLSFLARRLEPCRQPGEKMERRRREDVGRGAAGVRLERRAGPRRDVE